MGLERTEEGRTGAGSVYICAHGEQKIQHAVVDWRPFDYYTYESAGALPETINLVTTYLEPTATGTKMVGVCGKTMGPETASLENDAFILENVPEAARNGCQALLDRIQGDIELGVIIQPAKPPIDLEAVDEAVRASLTGDNV
jgi:hypothetical protein